MSGAAVGQSSARSGSDGRRPTYLLVQVLRAFAALIVVAHHSVTMLGQRKIVPIERWYTGAAGVDIFFVISGFVMTVSSDSLRSGPHPARVFLARRLERIVPLYWLMTAIKIALMLAVPALAVNAFGGWRNVVDSYLFLPGLFDRGVRDPVIMVGWTLDFEMAFYALFAVALAVRGSLLKIVAPVLVVVALLNPLLMAHPVRLLSAYCQPIVLEFLFGILLARAVQRWGPPPFWISVTLVLGGLCILFGRPPENLERWPRLVWWGLPAWAMVTGGLGLERKLGPLVPRWMLALGDASYSIYLVHTFVLPVVGVVLARLGASWLGVVPVSMAVCLCVSAVSGWLLYRVVEVPIMRYFKGRRGLPVAAGSATA